MRGFKCIEAAAQFGFLIAPAIIPGSALQTHHKYVIADEMRPFTRLQKRCIGGIGTHRAQRIGGMDARAMKGGLGGRAKIPDSRNCVTHGPDGAAPRETWQDFERGIGWRKMGARMPKADKSLPFDGAISAFLTSDAPVEVRAAISDSSKRDIITPGFPYERWMKKSDYNSHMNALQVELAKFHAWVVTTGQRVAVIFEGRDTAGKSGAIKRVTENLNPRTARIMALSKPDERERGEWYFQRYAAHLPTAGEMVLMDRSWYNRAVIEHVFGFCTPAQRENFFVQLPDFERILIEDGVKLIKLWFNVGRPEQLRRMLERERHVLKQWKLSLIDVQGLTKWDSYSAAIAETFARSHFDFAPWTVIRGDDKYRARISAIQRILGAFDYTGKDAAVIGAPDPLIMGGPDLWLKS